MLPLMIELRRSTVPDTSNDSRRASRWRKIVSSSTRATCAPMQKCSPKPNARCGFGRRSTRNANGSSNTSSSRFADAKYSASCSPARIFVAAHLAVLGGGAREVADRADPAQDLLDRVGQQLGAVAQLLPLAAVLGEREQPAADRVARRLVARLDEQLAVRDELLLGERRAVDLAADQLAHQVVLRVAAALVDQALEVGVHLAARPLDGLARRLARAPVLGIVLADHLVGPAEQQLPVVARHAEDPRDHRERERRGDALDEVELARGARGRRVVEDLDRDALDVVALRRAPRAA